MRPTKRISARPALRLQILEDRSLPSFGLGWAFNVGAVYWFATAIDSHSGSVYVSGSFNATTNFDPNNTNSASNHVLTPTGQIDGYVAKYLPDGTFQWATDVGPDEIGPYAQKVAVQGNAVFARFPAANADGTDNKRRRFTARPDDRGRGLDHHTTDSAGTESGGVKIGPSGDAYTTWNSGGRLTVSRLDYASGNVLWTATSNDNTNGGLAVDGSGNAYVLASLKGTATFGNTTLSSWTSGDTDIAVWKLNANGGSLWAGKMGVMATTAGRAPRSTAAATCTSSATGGPAAATSRKTTTSTPALAVLPGYRLTTRVQARTFSLPSLPRVRTGR